MIRFFTIQLGLCLFTSMASALVCGALFLDPIGKANTNILVFWNGVTQSRPDLAPYVEQLLNGPMKIENNIVLAKFILGRDLLRDEVAAIEQVHLPDFFKSNGLATPAGYGLYSSSQLRAVANHLRTVFSKEITDILMRAGVAGIYSKNYPKVMTVYDRRGTPHIVRYTYEYDRWGGNPKRVPDIEGLDISVEDFSQPARRPDPNWRKKATY